MKKFYIIIIALLGSSGLLNARDFPAGLKEDLQNALDYQISSTPVKGAAATVILSDGSEWTGTSGTSNGSTGIDASKLFSFGSQGKELTAACVFKLQEAGLLSIDDSIGKYLNDLPNIRKDLPIKRYMNHTSGANEYWEPTAPLWGIVFSDRPAILTLDEAASYIPESSGEADPTYRYTNTNTLVLALLIEKVTGNPASEEISHRIFDPLGMTSSVIPTSDFNELQLNGIWAYNGGNPDNRSDLPHDSYFTSRVAWMGTIAESAHFCRALHTGQLLNAENTALLYDVAPGSLDTLDFPEKGILNTYGYGVNMLVINGTKIVGHPGNGLSISMAFHCPEKNYTLAAAINTFDANAEIALLIDTLFHLVNPVMVSVDDQLSRRTSFEIYPNPASDFIHFRLDDAGNGNLSAGILDMNGRTIRSYGDLSGYTSGRMIALPLDGDLQEGYYLLRVNNGREILTKPFIRSR